MILMATCFFELRSIASFTLKKEYEKMLEKKLNGARKRSKEAQRPRI
jgi:hypothetical protein